MNIYIPAKNLYSDCLHIIGVAKAIATSKDKIYMMKNLFYHNKKRNYYYTHNFDKYFSLKTISFVEDDGSEFLHNFYSDLDYREKVFRQEITFPNTLVLNRHHFKYIYQTQNNIKLEFPIPILLNIVLKEVDLKFSIEKDTNLSDRIGVYVCYDSSDDEKELNNTKVLDFLQKSRNNKLFVVCDDKQYLPKIDKSNDVILYDKNVKLFLPNSIEQDNLDMLKNTLDSVCKICQCKQIITSDNLFCNLFIPFIKSSIKLMTLGVR